VADHIRNIEILPYEQPHYIYNIRLRNDKFQRLHGPHPAVGGTGLTEGATNGNGVNPAYLLPIGTPYAFCTEAIAEKKEVRRLNRRTRLWKSDAEIHCRPERELFVVLG